MRINSANELIVYKKAYELAKQIFHISNKFPAEEKYPLTSHVRRFSHSVCLKLREWRYKEHFISKLTDCDGKNSETGSSLDFAYDCGYIS